MISFEEARAIIINSVKILDTQKVELLQALGHTLAEDVYSNVNIPPFNNSAMDGYAVIAADTSKASEENPAVLEVIADLPAGRVAERKINRGEAVRIMTGAPVPDGADAVVIVEVTETEGTKVRIKQPVEAGANIRMAGEDVKKGEKVLAKGKPIRSQEMGRLASLGISEVPVIRPPKVAIITTGDELVDLNEPLVPGRIRDSNRYSMYGQILEAGGIPIDLGLVKDNVKLLETKFKQALDKADVLITTGGVSVGDYDLVKDILSKLGTIYFWRVNIKPGKPTVFGMADGKPIFGLPGNPVSSWITFDQFVRPALLKMAGRSEIYRPNFQAVADHDIKKREGRKEFLRAQVSLRNNQFHAALTGFQGSGILSSVIKANGIMILPEDRKEVKKGEPVVVQIFGYPETEREC